MNFMPVWAHLGDLAQGLSATGVITGLSLGIGLVGGLLLGVVRLSGHTFVKVPSMVFIDFFRTTPPIIQLIWAYFVLPVITGYSLSALQAVTIALGLNTAAFMAEIFRAGISGVDVGQWDGTKVLGLGGISAYRFVVLPQAIRSALPALSAQAINLLKSTPIVGVLAVSDLTYRGTLVALATARPTEVFIVVAAMYAIVVYPASALIARLERRLRKA